MKSRSFNLGESSIRLFVGTWNVNAKIPKDTLSAWLSTGPNGDMLDEGDNKLPDIYVVGLQEVVALHAINLLTPGRHSRPWEKKILSTLGKHYRLVGSQQLVGLVLLVAVREELFPYISKVESDTVGVGFLNVGGNKGAVAISMQIDGTSLCFVVAHLAAHKQEVEARNRNFQRIVDSIGFAGKRSHLRSIYDHDFTFFFGDLNYRLNHHSLNTVLQHITNSQLAPLLATDQLIAERLQGKTLCGFNEGEITFPPTYKYAAGTLSYATPTSRKKRRMPAWCDRILWKVGGDVPPDNVEQIFYTDGKLKGSDHLPVCSLFTVKISPLEEIDALTHLWLGGVIWGFFEVLEFVVLTGQLAVQLPLAFMSFIEALSAPFFLFVRIRKLLEWVDVVRTSTGSAPGAKRRIDCLVLLCGIDGYDPACPEKACYNEAHEALKSCVQTQCDGTGLARFAHIASLQPSQLFFMFTCNFVLMLLGVTALFFLVKVVTFVFRPCSRRCRRYQAQIYPQWHLVGILTKTTQVVFFLLVEAAMYQLWLNDNVLLSILAFITLGLLFSMWLKAMSLISTKESYVALFRNSQTRMKYGAIFCDYNISKRRFYLFKLVYLFSFASVCALATPRNSTALQEPVYSYLEVFLLIVVQIVFTSLLVAKRPYNTLPANVFMIFMHSGRVVVLAVMAAMVYNGDDSADLDQWSAQVSASTEQAVPLSYFAMGLHIFIFGGFVVYICVSQLARFVWGVLALLNQWRHSTFLLQTKLARGPAKNDNPRLSESSIREDSGRSRQASRALSRGDGESRDSVAKESVPREREVELQRVGRGGGGCDEDSDDSA